MGIEDVIQDDAKHCATMNSWIYINFKHGLAETVDCNLTPEAFMFEWNNPFVRTIKCLTKGGYVIIRKKDVMFIKVLDYNSRPKDSEFGAEDYPFSF